VSVAAKKVPLFKVGKELRLRVDGQPVTEADLAGDANLEDDDNDLDDDDDAENDE
jgi:hypothetical protein